MRTLINLIVFLCIFNASPGISDMNQSETTIVQMDTSKGQITLELYDDKASATVANFVSYAKDGFFEGTVFHRVIPGFMIQGGGFTADMKQKPTRDPIKNEANNGLKNDVGTVAMARTSYPHSATSQFFINVKNNDFLNFSSETAQGWGYAVFGKVNEGMDVVNSIVQVPTGRHGPHQDVPVEPVIIEKVTVIE